MSVRVMAEIFDAALKPGLKVTLLAIADRVEHDGSGFYYSLETLAWKAGHHKRTIRRQLRELERWPTKPLLVVVRAADRRRPTEYRLDVEAIKALPRANPAAVRPSKNLEGANRPPTLPEGADLPGRGGHASQVGGADLPGRGGAAPPNPNTEPRTKDPTAEVDCAAAPGGPAPTAPPPDDDVLIWVPLNGPHDNPPRHGVTRGRAAEWVTLYPGVDVPYELGRIAEWNRLRPRQRKTDGLNVERHINAWLAGEQNKARAGGRGRASAAPSLEPGTPPAAVPDAGLTERFLPVRAALAEQLPEEDRAAWLDTLHVLKITAEGVLLGGVPNSFFAARVRAKLRDPALQAALRATFPECGGRFKLLKEGEPWPPTPPRSALPGRQGVSL